MEEEIVKKSRPQYSKIAAERLAEIATKNATILSLTEDNTSLENALAEKESSISSLNEKISALNISHSEESALKESTWESQKTELTESLKMLRLEIKQNQAQINEMKLHRMASSFESQEFAYGDDVKEWLRYLFLALLSLIILSIWSFVLVSGKSWQDRLEFYLADFLLIGAVWFCGAQYTYYTKLKNDYANRKTIANTYHNLLLSIEENSPENPEYALSKETKNLIMSKASEVLCAPSLQDNKESILSKKIIKDMLKFYQQSK